MMKIIVLLCLLASCQADILSLVDTELEPDLSASPCQLAEADVGRLDPALKHVLVHALPAENKFVQDATHSLSRLGYRVCVVASASATAAINIHWNGRQVVYHGKRDAPALLRFIQQTELRLSSPPYEVIGNKMHKKAYEHVNVPKLVGYFADPNSLEFQTFVQAASQLSPNTPCYVVHDQALAAKIRLTQVNQVALVRRLEKSTVYFPASNSSLAWTANDLVSWVHTNRGLVLHELDDTNLYDPEIHKADHYQLAAIGNRVSPLGLYFFKILNKSIQNISRSNDLQASANEDNQTASPLVLPEPISLADIKVVWIDLSKYPSTRSKVEALVGSPAPKNSEVWFGLMRTPASLASSPVWFDMSLLNTTTGDKQVDENNVIVLRDWILQVTNRLPTISLTPQPDSIVSQSFALEPEPVSVRQGSSFVLDCTVSHKTGECSWTRAGQTVQVTGNPYQWSGETAQGECSLMVKAADKVRDSGEWICHVSDSAGQSISSRAAVVNVRESSNAEL